MAKMIFPPMHTAQHLLNQTMVRLFGCERNFSAHIEKKKSKCDYRFDRALTAMEVEKIEDRVNRIIAADLPISEEYLNLPEAEKLYSLKRLPEKTETIRVIKIGDYDAVPCTGPHVKTTAEIGHFKIISTDFNSGTLRIRFKLL
jgi:Ser-tRNA(Ala) deacylase AlaX